MPNDKKDRRPNDATSPGLSRRNFIAFAAGLTAAATGTASDREQRVIDMDTDVKTPDGICDAVFIHPARGSHPGVLLWHDRSEEHTSELQSRGHLVCRLLLEKKKTCAMR